jgi:Domain of unknown function (DUF4401)
MTALAAFCARMGLEEAAVRQALTSRSAHSDAPWYMQAVLGIGAWVTVIAGLLFAWAVMDLVFGVSEPNLVVALVGAVVFAAALWLLHHRPDGAFSAHMAVAFATAGTLLVAAGIGVPADSLWVAAAAILPLAAAAIWQQRSLLLQFLVASIALMLWVGAAWDLSESLVANVGVVAVPLGVALLLYPLRLDVRPTAFALLIVPPSADLVLDPALDISWFGLGWPAKVVFLVVFGLLLALNVRRRDGRDARVIACAGAVPIIAVALLLPAGASSALVLLLLGYTLGSRSLAVLGALMEVYFIWQFYADLQSTLLTKSIILMSAGAVILLCYALLSGLGRAWWRT